MLESLCSEVDGDFWYKKLTVLKTGYGYIKTGEDLEDRGCRIKKFVKKSDLEKVTYFQSGRFFWNSVVGLSDVIVVETGDAVLVAKNGQGQKVREIVKCLKEKDSTAASPGPSYGTSSLG